MPKIDLTDEQLKKLEALLGESLTLASDEELVDPEKLADKHQLGTSTSRSPCPMCGDFHSPGESLVTCLCIRCGNIRPQARRRGTVISRGMAVGILCEECAIHGF